MRIFFCKIVFWVLMLIDAPLIYGQDIVLSDFEEGNYAWLPGGTWTVFGTCFGSGPAQGTLPGQQAVEIEHVGPQLTVAIGTALATY